jgi:iron complex transport system ATP-binding protein
VIAPEPAPAAIRLDGISVTRGGRAVVEDVSLEIAAGEWVCVIGPNGAGKSSLLGAVAGVIPAGGRIDVVGRRMADLRRRERARLVALVPQQPVIPEAFRVADYVLLGRAPYLGPFGAEHRSDVEVVCAVLERLDLWWAAGRRLDALSGGELQRVVLARALAQEAPILLLDEPTTGLDLGHQQRVLELVASLRVNGGLTVVSAMHDLTIAGQFAERFVLLDAGRVVADGSASGVLREDLIERHYGARVRVIEGDDGGTIVVPMRTADGALLGETR